jgi:undecaprenyl-diphosphatase
VTRPTPAGPSRTEAGAAAPGGRLRPVAEREVRAGIVPAATWVVLQVVGLVIGLTLVGRHGDGAVQPLDDSVHRWFIDHRTGLVGVAKVIAKVGDAPALGAIVVVATVVLAIVWRTRRALLPLAAYLGGEATVYAVRLVIDRPRPISANFPAPGAIAGVHETTWSIPSGHATACTAVLVAIFGMIALRRRVRWPWFLALVGSVIVAGSRLVLGVHWFTDVTTGAVLGAVWGVVVARWLGRPAADREASPPAVEG